MAEVGNAHMTVNGKAVPLAELRAPDLSSLLDRFGLKPAAVAIERNGQVVPRDRWAEVVLQDEDRIEIIRFVGGG